MKKRILFALTLGLGALVVVVLAVSGGGGSSEGAPQAAASDLATAVPALTPPPGRFSSYFTESALQAIGRRVTFPSSESKITREEAIAVAMAEDRTGEPPLEAVLVSQVDRDGRASDGVVWMVTWEGCPPLPPPFFCPKCMEEYHAAATARAQLTPTPTPQLPCYTFFWVSDSGQIVGKTDATVRTNAEVEVPPTLTAEQRAIGEATITAIKNANAATATAEAGAP